MNAPSKAMQGEIRQALAESPIPELSGKYTIELRDERDKVLERVEKPNYIGPSWANFAKFRPLPHLFPYGFPYNNGASLWRPDQTHPNSSQHHPWFQRNLPFDSVICTDADHVEDPDDGWVLGEVSAWASVWKTNVAAAGYRGQINEAECAMTNANIFKWVWDWTTQQGNGTYQSVYLGAIDPDDNCQINAMGPTSLVFGSSLFNTITSNFLRHGQLCYNPTADRWSLTCHANDNTGDYVRVMDAPGNTAAMLASDVGGVSGLQMGFDDLAWTLQPANGPWSHKNDSSETNYVHTTVRHPMFPLSAAAPGSASSGFLAMWAPAYGNWRAYMRYCAPDGTPLGSDINIGEDSNSIAWDGHAPALNETGFGICEVAGKLYISVYDDMVGRIARFGWGTDVGGPDFEAYIPLPGKYASATVYHIADDGTDLFVTTSLGTFKMTTAGSLIQSYGHPVGRVGNDHEDGLSPFYEYGSSGASGYNHYFGHESSYYKLGQRMHGYDPRTYDNTAQHGFLGVANMFPGTDGIDTDMIYWNGRLHWYSTDDSSRFMFVAMIGDSHLSRVLVDNPITKDATATMKISYELTLPDMDTLWLPYSASLVPG